jgi:hypothetical protein
MPSGPIALLTGIIEMMPGISCSCIWMSGKKVIGFDVYIW